MSSRRGSRGRAVSAIDIVEAAYRLAGSAPERWLAEILPIIVPRIERDGRVFAYEYDTRKPHAQWLERPIFADGDHSPGDAVLASFHAASPALQERIHRRAGAVTILSEIIGVPAENHAPIAPHAGVISMSDMLGVNASDPSGRGTYFCSTTKNTRIERSHVDVREWEQLAAHLAAAGRLRDVLGGEPEAVLSPTGEVLHSTRKAEPRLAMLARSARTIDKARLRANRSEPEALASWRALVDGRWSLVDVVESDGKRVLFAVPNSPEITDPRRLTKTEQLVASFAAMGHSNKLIAYELGASIGTIGAHIHGILKKLGLRTRVELVDRVAMMQSGVETHFEEGLVAVTEPDRDESLLARLSEAERDVAERAARGETTARIAKSRNVSLRTIENQLARIFAKLKVSSRSELTLRLR